MKKRLMKILTSMVQFIYNLFGKVKVGVAKRLYFVRGAIGKSKKQSVKRTPRFTKLVSSTKSVAATPMHKSDQKTKP